METKCCAGSMASGNRTYHRELTMSPELRKTVQQFLSDYDYFGGKHPDNEQHPFLKIAIELLQKCVVDDYKMINGTDWEYVRTTIGFDDKGKPILLDSWDDKVKRSLDNDR